MIEFLSSIPAADIMYAILAFVMFVIVLGLYLVHRDKNSNISFLDLVTTNGKLEDRKLIRFCTWLISSWGFVYLIIKNGLTEWYYVIYMGTWVANALVGQYMNRNSNNINNSYSNQDTNHVSS